MTGKMAGMAAVAVAGAALLAGCAAHDRGGPASASASASGGYDGERAGAGEPAGRSAGEVDRVEAGAGPGASGRATRLAGNLSLWGELGAMSGAGSGDAIENLRQVTFTREGADFDADVDPTGRWLAIASTRHEAASNLYLKAVDGRTMTQLTSDAGNDVMPAFSPDGERIAFASDRSGDWNLYILELSGGKPAQLTDSRSQDLHPSWSPDGGSIVFSSLGPTGQWEMVVVDVERPSSRRIIGHGLFPKFSPSGEKIVFQRARGRGDRAFGIWTVDMVDGEAVRPTEVAAATNAAVINPAWSPDGRRLAFATVVDPSADPLATPESADLWVVGLDGTGRVKLTEDPYANLQPVWAADGSIYFVSNRSGWDNVWAIRPGGSRGAVESARR